MPLDQTGSTPNRSSERLPSRPLDEIAAEHAQQRLVQSEQFAEQEAVDARQVEIGTHLADLALSDPEGQTHLGAYLETDAFPEAINACLQAFECGRRERQADYDVTTEPPRRLARILARELSRHDQDAEVAAAEADAVSAETQSTAAIDQATAREAVAQSFEDLIASLDGSNADKITQLVTDPALSAQVPESELAHLQAFYRIMQIADAVPEDGARVRDRIATLDLSTGVPDAAGFARGMLFAAGDENAHNLTEPTRHAIAAELGIALHEDPIRTGSDMKDVFERGIGTRTIRDPETGGLRAEPMFLERSE